MGNVHAARSERFVPIEAKRRLPPAPAVSRRRLAFEPEPTPQPRPRPQPDTRRGAWPETDLLDVFKANLYRPQWLVPIIDSLRRFGATFDERAAIYGALGFVVGAIAWHLVGFWVFVSDVVLRSPQAANEPMAVAAAATPVARRSDAGSIATGSIGPAAVLAAKSPATQPACIGLELDRSSGGVNRVSCIEDKSLKDAGHQRRGDLVAVTPHLQNAKHWATGTQLQTDAALPPATVEAAAVSLQDFNLDLSGQPPALDNQPPR